MEDLLGLQTAVVQFLVDSGRHDPAEGGVVQDKRLEGLDMARLAMMGRMTLKKRAGKIKAILPRTFEMIGVETDALLKDFMARVPPQDISGERNAAQFVSYLSARGARAFSLDRRSSELAQIELALFRVTREPAVKEPNLKPADGQSCGPSFRRSKGVSLLQCGPGSLSFLAGKENAVAPTEQRIGLAIVKDPSSQKARTFVLETPIWRFLSLLDDWHTVETASFLWDDFSPEALGDLRSRSLIEFEP